MRIETTDPITGNTIKTPEGHPFVIEGSGEGALKIYFESEASKQAYLDIEVEHLDPPGELHLIKILSIDGRRFTYELRAPLTEDAVTYIKSLIDSVVFSDLVVEITTEGFEARESQSRLKKHS